MTLEVLPCEVGHAGRQRHDEQLDRTRSLVSSTIGQRLIDSDLVAAHSRDVLRAGAVLHCDSGRRPVLAA